MYNVLHQLRKMLNMISSNSEKNDSTRYNIRGHKFSTFKQSFKKDLRKFSFKCRVTDQWNNLPEKIVDAHSINTFKNRLDKLWERDSVTDTVACKDFIPTK